MAFPAHDRPPEWYRARHYAHFDRRPSKDHVIAYVTNPSKVVTHGFFPFIMRPVRALRFTTHAHKKRRRQVKVRPVAYAAHMDTQIHAYYAWMLREKLEVRLAQSGLSESVLAYRRHSPARCNIEFALDAFREVTQRGEVDVLAVDVQGFFDGLDHQLLKAAWSDLLGTPQLPDDHFAVFRSVTRDRAVWWPSIRLALKDKHRRRAGNPGDPVCSIADFRSKIVPLMEERHHLARAIKDKKPPACIPKGVPVGIPQGSAISAVLANLYMLGPDQEMRVRLAAVGASYRRYSDDILVIASPGTLATAEEIVRDVLLQAKLAINDKKTERTEFREEPGAASVLRAYRHDATAGTTVPQPMAYLGLSFDGKVVRLRPSTVARYLIRMNRAVERGRIAASTMGEHTIKRRQIYAKMSRLGPGQAYGPWREDEKGDLKPPNAAPRLGFLGYAKRSADRTNSTAISEQTERLWEELHLALKGRTARIDN